MIFADMTIEEGDFFNLMTSCNVSPVTGKADVLMFGVLLGIDYSTTERCISSIREDKSPRASAEALVSHWVETQPDQTAHHLVDALKKSGMDTESINNFELFLKNEKFTQGSIVM